MEPNYYLVFSSLFLSFPAVAFIIKEEYPQALISLLCCISSVTWHFTKPRYSIVLTVDKFFAYSAVGLAIHTASKAVPYSLLPLSFFSGWAYLLYIVGYYHKCFSWHPNYTIATRWHMSHHICNGILGTTIVVLTDPDLFMKKLNSLL